MIHIMAIRIAPRNLIAPKVQEVLTKYGCIIKVRLGLHEATGTECANDGLILLQLVHEVEKIISLKDELNDIEGVSAKTVEI
ncbi:MAG: hypothetical protein ACRDAU_05090 [Clostridium sp.]